MTYISDFKSAPIDAYATTTDQGACANLTGSKWRTADGRVLTLVQNGGTALAAGKLVMGPKPVANHQGLVTVSYTANNVSAGTPPQVVVTLGGTAMTANRYANGLLVVHTGTGAGQTMQIASNTAQTSTTGNVTITLADIPAVALDTTSTINLFLPPAGAANGTNASTDGVLVTDHTALTGKMLGVAITAIAAITTSGGTFSTGNPSYGFVVSQGDIACLNDAGTTQGLDLMPSTNTDGAVMTYVAATGPRVGTSTVAGVTTDYAIITVQLG